MAYAVTTNAPVLVDPEDDWWNWNYYITGLARSLGVRDILLGKKPYPVKPTYPTYPGDAPPGSDTSPADLTEPTPEQLVRYKVKLERYEVEARRYESERAALWTIWQAIFQTVARRYLARFANELDNEVDIYRKLKEKLEPSLEDQKRRIRERHRRLIGWKPTNQSMGKWLDEWEGVLSHSERLEMEEFVGWLGTLDFLTALKEIEPRYAQDRLKVLRKDHSLDVFDEIDDYRKHWESRASKNRMRYLR